MAVVLIKIQQISQSIIGLAIKEKSQNK